MKVMHVFNNVMALPSEGSGEKTHNYFMSKAFENLGHEMIVFEPAVYNNESKKSIDNKRNFYRKLKDVLPKYVTDWLRDLYYIIYDFRFDKKILSVIEREKPDFIFERITAYHDSGLRAAREAGIPYAVEIHEMHDALSYKDRMNFLAYRRYLWIKLARKADLVVVVSTMLRDYLVGYGVDRNKILIRPNAVDLDLFQERGRREEVRKYIGVSDDDVVLGFVGGMHPYHGIDMMPDLCELLIRQGYKIKMLLVGNFERRPGGEEAFRRVLKERNIEDKFILTGGVPLLDVPGYIEALDIGLMPDSNEYGSPIKIFEYGSLGKPVVAPDYLPILDILLDGVNGMIFEAKSVDGMALKIGSLIADPEFAKRIGARLKVDVIGKYKWEDSANAVIGAIEPYVQ